MENTSKERRRLLIHFGNAIRDINRSILNPVVDPLTLDGLTPVMSMVAHARADYLHALFELSDQEKGNTVPTDVSKLKQARERYEELVAAATALETMIERGYLDVSSKAPNALAS